MSKGKENLYERILKYLIENPGATPREIADNIGVSISTVRKILYKLRDRGLVRRGETGYIATKANIENIRQTENFATIATEEVQHNTRTYTQEKQNIIEHIDTMDYKQLYEMISKITKILNELSAKVNTLEKEVEELRKILRKQDISDKQVKAKDKLSLIIRNRKIMPINEILDYLSKPLEEYVNNGIIIVLGNHVIDKEFYENFKSKFPLRVDSIKELTNKEKTLLKLLIEEGLIYLHAGREYRLTE